MMSLKRFTGVLTLRRLLSKTTTVKPTQESRISVNADGHTEVHIDIPIPKRVHRPNEDLSTLKSRLLYQSRKRGILESDLLCSTFVHQYMDEMSRAELEEFDSLLDENDWDLYYWTSGERPIPERFAESQVLKKMKKHFQNEQRKIIRMPDLS
jgi:succinate dehydrogenase assembly factor 2